MLVLHYVGVLFNLALKVPLLGWWTNFCSSNLVTLVRAASGIFVAQGIGQSPRPVKMLKLYEFEACPFCRKVRETLTELDLDVEVYPCPRETLKAYGVCENSRFRTEVKRLGGKQQFPYLVDENTGERIQDSSAIIEYLWKTYGVGATPTRSYTLGQRLCSTPFFFLPLVLRPLTTHGQLRVPSKNPKELLELWGFEGSPFVRVVREALCVLELPYVLRNVAHGSRTKRLQFREKYGAMLSTARRVVSDEVVQVPLLVDPNTGAQLLESSTIVKYLYDTYQDGPFSQESFKDYSTKGASATHGTIGGHKTHKSE